jgi:peptidoglycan/LPS O-acetylase OafA/YrhL
MFTIPRASDLNGASDTGLLVAGVTWTLPYEWLFYIALPILGLIFARTKNGIAALFGGLTLVALFGCYAWRNPFDPNILLSFGGGIVAAYWIRRERLRALARGRIAAVLGILCLLLCFVFIQNPFAPIPIVLLSVFFLAVASGNDLFGALKARPVRWLGTISYSTYLLHGLVVWFFLRQAFVELQGRSFTLVCGLACACLVLLNSLTYLLIEKPGMELGRKADSRLGEILQSGRATAKARRT